MAVLVGRLTGSGRRLAFLGVVHNYYQSRLGEPHPAPSFSPRKREEATLLVAQRIGRRGIQGRRWPCQPRFLPPASRRVRLPEVKVLRLREPRHSAQLCVRPPCTRSSSGGRLLFLRKLS